MSTLLDSTKLVQGVTVKFQSKEGEYVGVLQSYNSVVGFWNVKSSKGIDQIRFVEESYTSKNMIPQILQNGWFENIPGAKLVYVVEDGCKSDD
jgi:hypothetical protein